MKLKHKTYNFYVVDLQTTSTNKAVFNIMNYNDFTIKTYIKEFNQQFTFCGKKISLNEFNQTN